MITHCFRIWRGLRWKIANQPLLLSFVLFLCSGFVRGSEFDAWLAAIPNWIGQSAASLGDAVGLPAWGHIIFGFAAEWSTRIGWVAFVLFIIVDVVRIIPAHLRLLFQSIRRQYEHSASYVECMCALTLPAAAAVSVFTYGWLSFCSFLVTCGTLAVVCCSYRLVRL